MEDNPLDLEQHGQDTGWDVWKRRILFFVMIVLCITFAAPTFGSCTGAFDEPGGTAMARFTVGGEVRTVTDLEFYRHKNRLHVALNYLAPGRSQPLDDDGVWQYILLDAAAQDTGIHIPPVEMGRRLIEAYPHLEGPDGDFDEGQYHREVAQFQVSHRECTAGLQMVFRVREYLTLISTAYAVVPSEDVYQEWRENNRRLTAEYVVSPFADLEKEAAAEEPTDEDLKKLPLARTNETFFVLPRKTIETAYARAIEVTDEQFEKLAAYVEEAGLLTEGRTLDQMVYDAFYQPFQTGRLYKRADWLKVAGVPYDEEVKEYEVALKAWEEKGKPEGEEPQKPKDPAEEVWPSDQSPARILTAHWHPFVAREVVIALALEDLATRARAGSKSFSEMLPEYEGMGLRVVRNETPLADADLVEKYPEGLAKNNGFFQSARRDLKGPAEGGVFTPKVLAKPIPATDVSSRILDRGSLVMRLAGHEPQRERSFEETREARVAKWREVWVSRRAKERLEAVVAAVEGGKSLEDAASEQGLQVRRLRSFNQRTDRHSPPRAATGEDLSDELKAVAAAIGYRNLVVDSAKRLALLKDGEFLLPPTIDAGRTMSGVLMRLVSQRMPERIELRERELNNLRFRKLQDLDNGANQVMSFKALSHRFDLVRLDKKQPPSDGEKEQADQDG